MPSAHATSPGSCTLAFEEKWRLPKFVAPPLPLPKLFDKMHPPIFSSRSRLNAKFGGVWRARLTVLTKKACDIVTVA